MIDSGYPECNLASQPFQAGIDSPADRSIQSNARKHQEIPASIVVRGCPETDLHRFSLRDNVRYAGQSPGHLQVTSRDVGSASSPDREFSASAGDSREHFVESTVSPMANYYIATITDRFPSQTRPGIGSGGCRHIC